MSKRDEQQKLKREKTAEFLDGNYGLSKYARKRLEQRGVDVDKVYGEKKTP